MTNKQKYINAAQNLVELGLKDPTYGFACNSLEYSSINGIKLINKFLKTFEPNEFESNSYIPVYWGDYNSKRNNLARSLALLLMAEMEGN